jgi:ribulose-5-phosphate 4-epimerase/fuculose-1-phosphate aldolase
MQITMKGPLRVSGGKSSDNDEIGLRRDLAACYRLVAMFGWDDLLATHLSAKLSSQGAFLINPFGLMFEEITASSLVKINLDGDLLEETPYSVNRAGFVIHSAVHQARPDAACVMHLHTRDGVAVSATEDGVLPLNQTAIIIGNNISRHEYQGVAIDDSEREQLAADLGDRKLMLLNNHGTLAVGASIPETFLLMYMLEWACSVQVRTLAMGLSLHSAGALAIEQTFPILENFVPHHSNELLWPALLRKLDRVLPGYAD